MIFKDLDSSEKENFLEKFHQESFKRGEVIKKEQDILNKAFFIEKGSVSVIKSSSGEDIEVATIEANEEIIFSISCLIDNQQSITTVVAKDDTLIKSISKDDFFDFCQNNPKIGVKVLKNITEMLVSFLRKSDEKIAQMYKTLEEVL